MFQHELQLSSSYYVVRVEGDDLIDVVPYRRCPDLLYGTRTFRVTSSRVEGFIAALVANLREMECFTATY